MNNLAVITPQTPAVTPEQIDLVKRTVAQGATDAELHLYLFDCARHGVHPLDKLLHFTKRGGRYTPITSIDLMRARAAETGECAGITDPAFEGEGDTLKATVSVFRLVQGQRCEFTATARWSEYFPGDAQGHMWKKMPHTMLGKCAEALALRKAFPKQLHGLYEQAEMDQAGRVPAVETLPLEPAREDGAVTVVGVEERSGNKAKGGRWVKWVVTFSDGQVGDTWDEGLAKIARAAMQNGSPQVPILETKGQYTNLLSLPILENTTGPVGDALAGFAEDVDNAEAEERAALYAEVKRLGDAAKLSGPTRADAWRTYCGSAKPENAPLEGLNDLIAWLKTRVGE